MSAAANLQMLLRFLAQDAKVPLATTIAKVKDLQSANLDSVEALAKVKPADINGIFGDEKLCKQIITAAKRVSKKRAAGDHSVPSPKKKRKESLFAQDNEPTSPTEQETALKLPSSEANIDELSRTVLITNRAPLVLAFVVTLLKHTMPDQPLSSRLSLAQAYVSITSRARAVNLGIESGKSAEEEGFGEGQPSVTIMGKEVRVLRRWGYEWKDVSDIGGGQDGVEGEGKSRVEQDVTAEQGTADNKVDEQPALWALDLEALKKTSDKQPTIGTASYSSLPIYTPQSARAYLFKSFDSISSSDTAPSKKLSAGAKAEMKEQNLGRLLTALDLLYESWAVDHSPEELDKRTWSWYVKVRPDVQDGVAGWGGKNELKLANIIALRRGS